MPSEPAVPVLDVLLVLELELDEPPLELNDPDEMPFDWTMLCELDSVPAVK
jgi:hypothetical protein